MAEASTKRGWITVALLAGIAALLVPIAWSARRDLRTASARSAHAERYRAVGVAAVESGAIERAALAFQRALEAAPWDADLRLEAARSAARLAVRSPEALTEAAALSLRVEMEASALATADPALAALAEGNIALVRGDSDAAAEAYQRAIEADPDSAAAQYYAGNLRLKTGAAKEALPLLQAAAERAPDDWRYRLGLGRAYLSSDTPDRAVAELSRAAELRPAFETLRELGRAYLKTQAFEKAADTLKKALSRAADAATAVSVREDLGFALFKLGRYTETITQLRSVVRDSGRSAAWYNLGVAYQAAGDAAKAAEIFRDAVARDPGLGEGYVRLAAALVATGRRAEARTLALRLAVLAQKTPALAPFAQKLAPLTAAPETAPPTHDKKPKKRVKKKTP